MRVIVFAAGIMAAGLAGPALADPPEAKQETVTIRGSERPELIPDHVLWEDAFVYLTWRAKTENGVTGSAMTAEGIAALAKYSLHIPAEDVRTLVGIADAALTRQNELMATNVDAHTGPELSAEEHAARIARIVDNITDARDEIARQLPKRSFNAVKRWIARDLVPGMEVTIPVQPSR